MTMKREIIYGAVVGLAAGLIVVGVSDVADGATIAPAPKQTRGWTHTPPPATRPAPTLPPRVTTTPVPKPTNTLRPPVRPTSYPTYTRGSVVEIVSARTSRCGR